MPYKWSWSDHHWTVRPMGWFSKYFVRRLGSTELTFPCADRCFTSKYWPLKRRFNGSSRIIPRGPQLVHIGIWHKYIKNDCFRTIHHNMHVEMIRPSNLMGVSHPTSPFPLQTNLPSHYLPLFPSVWSGSLNQRVEASARFNPWSSSSRKLWGPKNCHLKHK